MSMSGEIIELPLTPASPATPKSPVNSEITKLKVGHTRRNSTGRASISNGKERTVPIYHRASIGSCHDLCKYGWENAYETNGRHSILKKSAKLAAFGVQSPTKMPTLEERKKQLSALKAKPSPEPKTPTLAHDKPKTIKRETKILNRDVSSPKVIKKINVIGELGSSSTKISSPAKKVGASPRPAISPTKVSSPSEKRVVQPVVSLKPKMVRTTSSFPMNSSSPKYLPNRVDALKVRNSNGVKPIATSKDQTEVGKVEAKRPNAEKTREKTLYVIMPKLEKTLSTICVDGNQSSRSTEGLLSSISSSPQSSQSICIDEEEPGYYESTLSKANESISEHKEIEDGKATKPKHRRKTALLVNSGDKDFGGTKNYRKGKMVNLEVVSNVARKLRFKRGKGIRDNPNGRGESSTKRYRMRREVENGNGTKPESEKVVLRRQGVQEKDEKIVINNVIEETASKLVGTRKSKVKALVGAFETVISLHDIKPSVSTSSG